MRVAGWLLACLLACLLVVLLLFSVHPSQATYDEAWDSGLHYGCSCDLGYRGNDCSLRECPSNYDPVDGNCAVTLVDEDVVSVLTAADGVLW